MRQCKAEAREQMLILLCDIERQLPRPLRYICAAPEEAVPRPIRRLVSKDRLFQREAQQQ
jgi:hypothetical protein